MSGKPKLDDLVQSVSLYTATPAFFHLYVLPFIIIYSSWLYLWLGIYGFEEHYEGGFVGIAVIGCFQILSCLMCYWSVHINCFFSCRKVNSIQYSSFYHMTFFVILGERPY